MLAPILPIPSQRMRHLLAMRCLGRLVLPAGCTKKEKTPMANREKTAKSVKRKIAKFFRTMGKKIMSPFVHCFGRNKVVPFIPSPELKPGNPGKANDDLVKSQMKISSGMKGDDNIAHPVAKADYDLPNTTKTVDVSSATQHYTGTYSISNGLKATDDQALTKLGPEKRLTNFVLNSDASSAEPKMTGIYLVSDGQKVDETDEGLGASGFTCRMYQKSHESDDKQVAIEQVLEWKHNPYTDTKANNNSDDAKFKTGTIPKTKGFIIPCEPKEKTDTNPANPKPKKPTSSTSHEVPGAIGFTGRMYQNSHESDGKRVTIKQVSKWTRNPCIDIAMPN
ncbi:uncharacterized protein [Paramisgurnus dabryanus]|uniref:uncharacterized protein n=1 Tax=Paramisgurnus dabryanus TaxID=90735 RepID=UPI0031F33842